MKVHVTCKKCNHKMFIQPHRIPDKCPNCGIDINAVVIADGDDME